jgi:hypothetical protein
MTPDHECTLMMAWNILMAEFGDVYSTIIIVSSLLKHEILPDRFPDPDAVTVSDMLEYENQGGDLQRVVVVKLYNLPSQKTRIFDQHSSG